MVWGGGYEVRGCVMGGKGCLGFKYVGKGLYRFYNSSSQVGLRGLRRSHAWR